MTLKYNKFGKKAAIPIELSEAEKIKIRAALKSLFKDLQYKLKIETTQKNYPKNPENYPKKKKDTK